MYRLVTFIMTICAWLLAVGQPPPDKQQPLLDVAQMSVAERYNSFFLEAICQRLKGNHDAAFDLLQHCIDIDSTRSEAWYYYAQYQAALKEKSKAIASNERTVQLEPSNATYQETLANTYIEARMYDKAIDVLEKFYEHHHDREDVLSTLVGLYEEQRRYEEAISALNKLEIIEGKSEQISFAKSRFYSELGNEEASIAEMKALADEHPSDANYRRQYARTLYNNGREAQALEVYRQILADEPNHSASLSDMLDHERIQGNDSVATQMLHKLLLSPTTTEPDRITIMRREIDRSENLSADSTEILKLFDLLLQQKQHDGDMTMLCAAYMTLKKMPTDTIDVMLRRALQLSPDNTAARLQLMSDAWTAGDMPAVISICHGGRQYSPDMMAFYYYQGLAYIRQNDSDNALDAFRNGIGVITQESDPEIVSDFYATMGDVLHEKGRESEAFAAYDSCLVWKEDNIMCLNNYAYFLSLKGQHLDKAEQMSAITVRKEPKNPTYLDTYAWVLFKQKRYAEAKIYIEQTLQCDTDTSAVMLEHAGDIYYYSGDVDKAVELWQQALRQAEEKSADSLPADDRQAILRRKIKHKKYYKE